MTIDPGLRETCEREKEEGLETTKAELAWESERVALQLEKLEKTFLNDVAVQVTPPTTPPCFSPHPLFLTSPHPTPHTLPTHRTLLSSPQRGPPSHVSHPMSHPSSLASPPSPSQHIVLHGFSNGKRVASFRSAHLADWQQESIAQVVSPPPPSHPTTALPGGIWPLSPCPLSPP